MSPLKMLSDSNKLNSPTLTHHSSSVALHKLDDASRVFVPQVDVSTVTTADHKLTGWAIEVHPLHCEK